MMLPQPTLRRMLMFMRHRAGPFLVHADNWAQAPNLTLRQSGFSDFSQAVKHARRVIQMGGNNADDTVRVYLRPKEPGWLTPKNALASLRRNGRRIEITLHRPSTLRKNEAERESH